MYSWLRPSPEPEQEVPEATWTEFAHLYLDQLRCVHVSQWDREERPIIYSGLIPSEQLCTLLIEDLGLDQQANGEPVPQEQLESEESDSDALIQQKQVEETPDFFRFPITLLTCFYIQTHKGIHCVCPPCYANTLTL